MVDASNGHKDRFLGFSVFVSNATNKDEGTLCFHDNNYYNKSTIPKVLTLRCKLHGKYVIYFNNRTGEQLPDYSTNAYVELCEFEVYGKQYYINVYILGI